MTYRTLAAAVTAGLLMIIVADARAGQQRRAVQTHEQHATTLPAGNVQHGRYLAEHVAMCIECHSGRDANGDILSDQEFEGGPLPFKPPEGWANRVPRNKGLPGYTDEEALRLLTEGAIGRDGKQLRPPMPRFRMTPRDAADVIAFLRSLH